MSGKMARSDTRTPLGRPGMLDAIHTAHLRYIRSGNGYNPRLFGAHPEIPV